MLNQLLRYSERCPNASLHEELHREMEQVDAELASNVALDEHEEEEQSLLWLLRQEQNDLTLAQIADSSEWIKYIYYFLVHVPYYVDN